MEKLTELLKLTLIDILSTLAVLCHVVILSTQPLPQVVLTLFRYLLWCMLCECVHSVPANVGVDEDKSSDSGENVGHAGLQLHAAQRVHAQIEEVQVGNV